MKLDYYYNNEKAEVVQEWSEENCSEAIIPKMYLRSPIEFLRSSLFRRRNC